MMLLLQLIYELQTGKTLSENLLDNDFDIDGDALRAFIVTAPDNGSAAVAIDGTLTYTPDAGFLGVDTFTYQTCDGDRLCRCIH